MIAKTTLCDRSYIKFGRNKKVKEAKNIVVKNNGKGEGRCRTEVLG